jgi:predicted GTPase
VYGTCGISWLVIITRFQSEDQVCISTRMYLTVIRVFVQLSEEYAGTAQGREVMRVRYVTQVSTRPPTFVAFVTGGEEFGSNSTRFLLNKLRGYFGFPGVPLRLTVRNKARGTKDKAQPVGVWMARKAPLRRKRRKKRDVFEWLR